MSTINVTGTLRTVASTAVPNAVVTFRLINLNGNLPTISGTNIIIPITLSVTADTSGFFSTPLQGNDTITPTGTLYEVVFDATVVATYNFTGSGTINLNSYPPVNVFPVPSGPVPVNILTGNNTFTGTNNFNGSPSLTASNPIVSSVLTGTAPFTISSTTVVANLNASFLNGATFASPGTIGGTSPGVGNFTTLTATGKVTKYNNISTVAGGIPAIYGNVNLTAQSAAISATTLYAVPAGGSAVYRISWVAKVTTASDISSVLGGSTGFQLVYTDPDDSVVVTTATQSPAFIDTRYSFAKPRAYGNTTGTQLSGVLVINAKAATNIQYQFGYVDTHTSTAMAYSIHIRLEVL